MASGTVKPVDESSRPAMASALTCVVKLQLMKEGSVAWSYEERAALIDRLFSFLEEMSDAIPKVK